RQTSGRGRKTWRTRSGNPRSSHRRMNGETVDLDRLFSKGARWPGDSALRAAGRAGCKCAVESESQFDNCVCGTPVRGVAVTTAPGRVYVLTKDAPALRVKTTINSDELAEGQFDALVSVFGNVDAYGDVVMPGAFSRTLKEWEASGYKIPVYWGHQMSDPDFNIGESVSAVETERGLQVRAQLDLDSPKAAQVYRLLKGGRVKEFSFGYSVRDASWADQDGQEVYQLHDVDLYEVSVVPVGANPETELQSVKTLGERTVKAGRRALDTLQAKAGRVLSAKNESALRDVRDQL